jgi:hypothetical protein
VLLIHGKSPPYCGTKKKLKYLRQKSPTDPENGANEKKFFTNFAENCWGLKLGHSKIQ